MAQTARLAASEGARRAHTDRTLRCGNSALPRRPKRDILRLQHTKIQLQDGVLAASRTFSRAINSHNWAVEPCPPGRLSLLPRHCDVAVNATVVRYCTDLYLFCKTADPYCTDPYSTVLRCKYRSAAIIRIHTSTSIVTKYSVFRCHLGGAAKT